MKVILLQDIKNVGRRHEIKNVSDGYARNMLLPRRLAVLATPEELKKIEKENLAAVAEEKELVAKLKSVTDGEPIKFYLKTGDKGEIYTSIKAEDIEEELKRRGLEEIKVKLSKPIKNLGLTEVEIHWRKGIVAKVKISVEPSPR
ncbi:MAG: 50S ribosomal protein L9 [Patescibacteria group bacterium]|nr:50S ribosomal protein L9 [Patescibacteria group bacterium]MCL5261757.1 50S ribosomal protein L9 [Patescibacteria group bacterium]